MLPDLERPWVVEFHPEFSREILGFCPARNLLVGRIAEKARPSAWQTSSGFAEGIEALESEGAPLPRR